MNRENFCHELVTMERYACSVHNLMETVAGSHFKYTANGWLDKYIKDGASTQEQAAPRWMYEHYDLVSAATQVAADLVEVMSKRLLTLWLDADKLILDAKSESPRRRRLSAERLCKTNSRHLFTTDAQNEKMGR